MSIFADTRQTNARFGHDVEALRLMFQTHGVNFGSAEEFARFEPKLVSDGAFRCNLAALVSTIAAAEKGMLSITEILTIMAIAVGGTDIDQKEREISGPVSTMVIFLAGIGGWKAQQNPSSPTQQVPAIPPQTEHTEPSSPTPFADPETPIDAASGSAMEAGLTDGFFRMPPGMQKTLDRLELNGVQLKLYLDDINSRMGRIEPHIEDLTSVVHSSAHHLLHPTTEEQGAGEETGVKSDTEPIPGPPIHVHRWTTVHQMHDPVQASAPTTGLEPASVSANVSVAAPVQAASSINLKSKQRSHRAATAPYFILLFALLTTGSVMGYLYLRQAPAFHTNSGPSPSLNEVRNHPSVEQSATASVQKSSPTIASVHAINAPLQIIGKASSVLKQQRPTAAKESTASNAPVRLPAPARAYQTSSQPRPELINIASPSGQEIHHEAAMSVANAEHAPSPVLASKTASSIASSAPSPLVGTAPSRADNTPSSTSPSTAATAVPRLIPASAVAEAPAKSASLRDAPVPIVRSAPPSHMLEVSSAAMLHNVLFAPKPPYPSFAVIHGVQGTIILHAAISKDGSIESLHVISGPLPLRQTTLETVSKWRFKPYLIDGEPARVGTTIEVLFHTK